MFFSVLCSRAAAASATLGSCLLCVAAGVSFESSNGKGDGAEEVAGTLIPTRTVAFLVGYTVIGCIYKELCGSFDADYREDAEGNEHLKPVLRIYELAVEEIKNGIRDVRAVAGANAAILSDLSAKDNRLDRFNYGNRVAGVNGVKVGGGTE